MAQSKGQILPWICPIWTRVFSCMEAAGPRPQNPSHLLLRSATRSDPHSKLSTHPKRTDTTRERVAEAALAPYRRALECGHGAGHPDGKCLQWRHQPVARGVGPSRSCKQVQLLLPVWNGGVLAVPCLGQSSEQNKWRPQRYAPCLLPVLCCAMPSRAQSNPLACTLYRGSEPVNLYACHVINCTR